MFNLNGPALNSWNIHRCVMVYNSLNQETERRWYDVSGNLTTYNTDKYAIVRYKYDLLGNVVSTAYFGVDKKPVKCNEGWASTLNVYNKMGKIVKQSFFDINGNPTDPKVMVPVGICDYDKWGNMTFIASQDGHGHYIINPQTGWAILRMTYDSTAIASRVPISMSPTSQWPTAMATTKRPTNQQRQQLHGACLFRHRRRTDALLQHPPPRPMPTTPTATKC